MQVSSTSGVGDGSSSNSVGMSSIVSTNAHPASPRANGMMMVVDTNERAAAQEAFSLRCTVLDTLSQLYVVFSIDCHVFFFLVLLFVLFCWLRFSSANFVNLERLI